MKYKSFVSKIILFSLFFYTFSGVMSISHYDNYANYNPQTVTANVYGGETVTDVVYFADSNLESSIKDQLYYSGEYLTKKALDDLTFLAIYNKEIVTLDGLEHAENLRHIEFVGGKSHDISGLKKINSLEYVIFDNHNVTDYQTLSNLDQIRYLRLTKVPNIDFQTVTNNVYLREFHIVDSDIADISSISKMKSLTSLSFERTMVSDISAICDLINIEDTTLAENQISDISCLSNLKQLKYLNISKNKIKDISVLSDLPNLISVVADYNNINEIPDFQENDTMEVLSLSSNNIDDVTPLNSFTNLKNIHLNNNNITDISAFETKSDMSQLSLNSNEISDISYLKADQNETMQYLRLKDNRINIAKYQDVIESFEKNGTIVEYDNQRYQNNRSGSAGGGSLPSDSVSIGNNGELLYKPIVKRTVQDGEEISYVTISADLIKGNIDDISESILIEIDSIIDEALVVNLPEEISSLLKNKEWMITILTKDVEYSLPSSILSNETNIIIRKLNESEKLVFERKTGLEIDSLFDFDILNQDNERVIFDQSVVTKKIRIPNDSDYIKIGNFSESGSLFGYLPFTLEQNDEEKYAVFKRNTNGIYGIVLSTDKSQFDVDHWVEKTLNSLQGQLEIFDETIDLRKNITREEFVHYLISSLQFVSHNRDHVDFSDIKNSSYVPDIEVATKLGFISGYNNKKFMPLRDISREEMASIAIRVLRQYSDLSQPTKQYQYNDHNEISNWANSDIYSARENEIMIGDPNNTFRPKDKISVAEAIVVIYNILRHLEMI